MPNCFVENCKSSWKLNDPYKMMHSFPRDRNLIKEWLCRLPNQNLNVDQTVDHIFASQQGKYRICSKHFGMDSYYLIKGSPRLRKGAIPTIFMEPLCTDGEEQSPLRPHNATPNNELEKQKPRTVSHFVEHSYASATQPVIIGIETLVTSDDQVQTTEEEVITLSIDSANEITLYLPQS